MVFFGSLYDGYRKVVTNIVLCCFYRSLSSFEIYFYWNWNIVEAYSNALTLLILRTISLKVR